MTKHIREMGLKSLDTVRGFGARRRLIVAVLVACGLTLLGAGVGIAGKAAGWWSNGQAVSNPAAVRGAFANPSLNGDFIKRSDFVNARTVAQAGDIPLIAVPQKDGGYCITPSIEKMSDTPIACDDGAEANTRDMFISWSLARGQRVGCVNSVVDHKQADLQARPSLRTPHALEEDRPARSSLAT
jgi:hypothetical protein